ncbi:hypothetical protein AVEN_241504-1 [Araneus ventricosus]|uniref:Uncharacterized protein n=1 Tax=Araneus ventricosus TaxID=182803 RepID=A0A4Y2FLK9_ARAVE|nr:hypothetical protein AVEN_241504-1 [Araneus ventricosus]
MPALQTMFMPNVVALGPVVRPYTDTYKHSPLSAVEILFQILIDKLENCYWAEESYSLLTLFLKTVVVMKQLNDGFSFSVLVAFSFNIGPAIFTPKVGIRSSEEIGL